MTLCEAVLVAALLVTGAAIGWVLGYEIAGGPGLLSIAGAFGSAGIVLVVLGNVLGE